MKKLCYLLCFGVLTGCSKTEVTKANNPITVTYSFKASVNGTYDIYYVDPNSLTETQIQITNSVWTKTETIENANAEPDGYSYPLGIGTTSTATGATYTLTIMVNNKVESMSNFTSASVAAYTSYNYVITR